MSVCRTIGPLVVKIVFQNQLICVCYILSHGNSALTQRLVCRCHLVQLNWINYENIRRYIAKSIIKYCHSHVDVNVLCDLVDNLKYAFCCTKHIVRNHIIYNLYA